VSVLTAFGGGAALGALYFVLLWKTVERMSTSARPVLLAAASFFGRAGGIMAGFYLVSGSKWEGLIAALASFLLARAICLRTLGRARGSPVPQSSPGQAAGHVL